MVITSPVFDQGAAIPSKYTCDGDDLPARATRKDLDQAMRGHVLAKAELMGTYSR